MEEKRVLIRRKLQDNHLTSVWLINQLEQNGVRTDKAEMSNILNGSRKGPKVDEIMEAALNILHRYEKSMGRGTG